jgi:hypothetical protein
MLVSKFSVLIGLFDIPRLVSPLSKTFDPPRVCDLFVIRGKLEVVREADGSMNIALTFPSLGIGKRFFTSVDLV